MLFCENSILSPIIFWEFLEKVVRNSIWPQHRSDLREVGRLLTSRYNRTAANYPLLKNKDRDSWIPRLSLVEVNTMSIIYATETANSRAATQVFLRRVERFRFCLGGFRGPLHWHNGGPQRCQIQKRSAMHRAWWLLLFSIPCFVEDFRLDTTWFWDQW